MNNLLSQLRQADARLQFGCYDEKNLPIRRRLQSTDMQNEQLPKEMMQRRAMLFIEQCQHLQQPPQPWA